MAGRTGKGGRVGFHPTPANLPQRQVACSKRQGAGTPGTVVAAGTVGWQQVVAGRQNGRQVEINGRWGVCIWWQVGIIIRQEAQPVWWGRNGRHFLPSHCPTTPPLITGWSNVPLFSTCGWDY